MFSNFSIITEYFLCFIDYFTTETSEWTSNPRTQTHKAILKIPPRAATAELKKGHVSLF